MKQFIWGGVLALAVAATSIVASAQEIQLRSGVVTAITAIQQAAAAQPAQAASSGGGALGRAFGRAAGRALGRVTGDSAIASDAYAVSSELSQDLMAGQANAQPATGSAHLVLVRFGDGSESAIQTTSAGNLTVGQRVRVIGSGSAAQVVAE